MRRVTQSTMRRRVLLTLLVAVVVAGVAAQMLLIEPDLSPAELERRIRSSPAFINDTQPEHAGGRVVTLFATPRRRAAKGRS